MNINCIVCDKELKPLDYDITYQSMIDVMYNGGGVGKIQLGYGSEHDGTTYLIPLCDNCINDLTKKQKLIFLYNYTRSF